MRISFFVLFCFVLSCSEKRIDPNKLCKDFYNLNRNKSFDGFFDVYMGWRSFSVYDSSVNQYEFVFQYISLFDTLTNSFVRLPVFKWNSTLEDKKNAFNKCDKEVKAFLLLKLNVSDEGDLFSCYVKYVENLLNDYRAVKTPSYYNNKNVIIESARPNLGKFIRFHLGNCICYFVESENSLNPFWSIKFKKINKIDSHWYYEISDKATE